MDGSVGLDCVPTIIDVDDYSSFLSTVYIINADDLPDNDESTDVVLETLVGLEMYKIAKESPDKEVQRRFLVGKWLYVRGFLSGEFPPKVRFIPGHLNNDI